MRASDVDADIALIGDTAVIRRKARADCRARILGEEVTDGRRKIYLDRLVHEPWVEKIGPYSVSGCISTILSVEVPRAG